MVENQTNGLQQQQTHLGKVIIKSKDRLCNLDLVVSACNSRKDRRIRISGHHLLPRIVEQLESHEILKKENES